jgi:hypothetical protein
LYEQYGEPDLVTCINWKGFSGRDMSKGWKVHEFLRKCLKLGLKE